MLHITDSHIEALLDTPGVIETLDAAFSDLAQGRAAIMDRRRIACVETRLSAMGAIWHARGVAGQKVYTTGADGFAFVVVLFDTRANRPLAVLDGAALTRFRTAAITALVARQAAPAQVRQLAVIGAGQQGRAQADAMCRQFRFQRVRVADPQPAQAWCQRLAETWGTDVEQVDTAEAVRDADIVVTATRATQPVLRGEWLKAGCFVAAVGSSAPQYRELDDLCMLRASQVIVEWKPQSMAEAGEITLWNGQRDLDKIVDLPQLYRGERRWRSGDDAITVFKTVGVGLSDVATGLLACQRLQRLAATPVGAALGSPEGAAA
jgi:ornithine cyclodeaminase